MSATKRTTCPKIQSTRNYRLFKRSAENRCVDLAKHKRLKASMEKYGFLPCFPIVTHKNGSAEREVKEGQHRLVFAEQLGLPVYYVDSDTDFDIAEINCTPLGWKPLDYALKFAANGNPAYQEGLDFAEQNSLPVGKAFALLAGTTSFKNLSSVFFSGKFKVKDRDWATLVASIYVPMVALSRDLKSVRFLEACMRVCRVPDFSASRLLKSASRCREKLIPYSTTEAYLAMIEDIYNFGRQQRVALKIAAENAMRERNAIAAKKQSKRQRSS